MEILVTDNEEEQRSNRESLLTPRFLAGEQHHLSIDDK